MFSKLFHVVFHGDLMFSQGFPARQEIREKVTVERERRRAMDELKQISAIRGWA